MGLNEGEIAATAGKVNSLAFFILSLISAILPVFVLNPVAKKIGMVKTHYLALFIMAIGYAGIFFLANTPLFYYIFIAIAGIGWGSVVSLPFAIMSEKVDQTKMGLYMGIFNLSVVLPQMVASFKMGEIINNAADKSIVFGICAVTIAISGVLWLFVKNEK
jgi:MFS family permease